jgi:glutamate-1-semialdehyde aminotransferase/acyl carrier protein
VALAAVNAPGLTVVSGPDDAIAALEARLAAAGQEVIALHTSHAFHSAMMDPVLGPFEAAVAAVRRRPPRRPFVSTLTGTWITDAEATDPGYWARQLRHTVRFSAALETLFEVPHRLLLEVGPSQNLSTSARQHRAPGRSFEVVSSLGGPRDARPADEALMEAVGRLWIAGAPPDWAALAAGESRRKVRLPGYPFERVRHWVEPPPLTAGGEAAAQASLPSEAAAPAPTAPTAPAAPGVRADRIRAKLRALLLELSGIDIAEGARQTPFTDMGFDSLFLTQASAEIQAQLGVKVKFRRLLEDVTTLDALTALLDAELPPDALPAPVVAPAPSAPAPARALAPAPAPAPASAPAAGGFLEEVIRTQLAVMNQQLEALRGGAVAPPAAQTSATQPAEAPAGVPVSASYAKDKGRRGAVPYRPIEKAPGGGLTEVQQRHLDGLIQRLGAKTRTSKAQAQQHRRTHADPRGVSGFKAAYKELVYQLVMERSLGARIWDVDGNEYVDITGGFGINFLGYSPPFVRAAVEAQLEKGLEVAPQSPLAGEVADLFCKLTGHDRVFFVNTGSEAVMAAVRLARTVTGRSRIAYFAGAYHGVHDEVLGRAQNNGGRLVTLSAAPGVPAAAVSEALVLEYGAEESLELIQRHAHELAAVLIEPVQSRVPELVPVEFLRRLRAITEASGTAFIMDEVITGFRAHLGGLQAAWGIKADLATYGKVVGGGMPIGVVAGKAAFMDAVDGGAWRYGDTSVPEADVTYFAGTFHRHPVALAAAKAVLEHLERAGPSLQEDLNARTAAFVGRLNAALEGRGVPVRLSHFSSWFRFEIPSDVVYAPLLAFHLLERGVYCRQIGQNNFFSTTHTDADLAFIERAILDGVDALLAADFLPRAAGAPALAAVAAAAPTPALPARAAPPRAPQPGAPPPDGPLPLSEAQREIWLTSQMGPGASCAFNESFTLDLVGPLSQAALRQALTQLLARHHALSFVFAADGQSQRHQPAPLVLTEHPEGEDLEALRRAEATTPFELQRGPLSRWHLARRGPEHHQLIFTVHHIVLDGWSAGVVLEDLGALYTAALRGEPDASSPAQAYADYVAWEQRTQAGAEGAASLEYWRRLFLGAEGAPATEPPALELPTDRPRPPLKGFQGDSHQGRVPADVLAAAKAAARREGGDALRVPPVGLAHPPVPAERPDRSDGGGPGGRPGGGGAAPGGGPRGQLPPHPPAGGARRAVLAAGAHRQGGDAGRPRAPARHLREHRAPREVLAGAEPAPLHPGGLQPGSPLRDPGVRGAGGGDPRQREAPRELRPVPEPDRGRGRAGHQAGLRRRALRSGDHGPLDGRLHRHPRRRGPGSEPPGAGGGAAVRGGAAAPAPGPQRHRGPGAARELA